MISEDAQARNLFGHVIHIGFGIFLPDSEEHKQSHPDFARDPSVDGDLGPTDALYDGSHILRNCLAAEMGTSSCSAPIDLR